MEIYPPSLETLIEQFSRLPGIGNKSATRMALHILKSPEEQARTLARALVEIKETIRYCSICFNFTDSDPCPICSDDRRANGVLCVVEGPADQLAIEETGGFQGRYHVLHGVLSPLDGIGPENLKLGEFIARIDRESIEEVVLATNPTAQGEATASYLADLVSGKGINVTRIALGVPMGGDLRYMDSMTLKHSIQRRTQVS